MDKIDWSKVKLFADEEDKRRWKKAVVRIGVLVVVLGIYFPVLSTHSEAMAAGIFATLLFGGILAGAVFFIAFVRGIASPDKPLPPSVRLGTNYRGKLKTTFLVFVLYCAATIAISLTLPSRLLPETGILDGLGFLFLVYLILRYRKARKIDREIAVLQFTGTPMHWQFEPELWQRWIEAEVARLVPQEETRRAEKLRRRLAAFAPEAYFGETAYTCVGVYSPWSDFECHLVSANIDTTAPRRLLFNFHKKVPAGKTQWNSFYKVETVPIPPGVQTDLANLQRLLESRCPEALVALV